MSLICSAQAHVEVREVCSSLPDFRSISLLVAAVTVSTDDWFRVQHAVRRFRPLAEDEGKSADKRDELIRRRETIYTRLTEEVLKLQSELECEHNHFRYHHATNSLLSLKCNVATLAASLEACRKDVEACRKDVDAKQFQPINDIKPIIAMNHPAHPTPYQQTRLAEGPASPGARVQHAWAEYHQARDRELLSERAVSPSPTGLWAVSTPSDLEIESLLEARKRRKRLAPQLLDAITDALNEGESVSTCLLAEGSAKAGESNRAIDEALVTLQEVGRQFAKARELVRTTLQQLETFSAASKEKDAVFKALDQVLLQKEDNEMKIALTTVEIEQAKARNRPLRSLAQV